MYYYKSPKVKKLKVYKVKELQLAKVNLLLENIYFYKFSVAYVYSVDKVYSSEW